jgi:hypothetical protein
MLSYERVIKIYNDKSGDYIYVGPDADGLDMVEIRDVDMRGPIMARFALTKEQALLVAKAINELYGDKE